MQRKGGPSYARFPHRRNGRAARPRLWDASHNHLVRGLQNVSACSVSCAVMPDRNRNRRPEFEVAWYTPELGKSLQREMLQKQLARFSENGSITGSHGEDTVADVDGGPPSDDRAG